MTNLTQHHKALLHRFLRDYDQHMSCPEIGDERLQGAPNYMTTFFTTHYYATLDSRPSLPRPELGTTCLSSCSTTMSNCLTNSIQRHDIELEQEQRELLSAGYYLLPLQ